MPFDFLRGLIRSNGDQQRRRRGAEAAGVVESETSSDNLRRGLRGMSYEEGSTRLAPNTPEKPPTIEERPAPPAPIDQHRLPHEKHGSFCGIATMAMAMRHHGVETPTATREDVSALARGVYIPEKGASGSAMANRLSDKTGEDMRFSTQGDLDQIVSNLEGGGVVPLGVTNIEGIVEHLPVPSERYPHLKEGARHQHRFGRDGHWVLVVGYEGTPEKPTAFLVNDPDVGGRLRLTPDQLKRAGAANRSGGGMWTIGGP